MNRTLAETLEIRFYAVFFLSSRFGVFVHTGWVENCVEVLSVKIKFTTFQIPPLPFKEFRL